MDSNPTGRRISERLRRRTAKLRRNLDAAVRRVLAPTFRSYCPVCRQRIPEFLRFPEEHLATARANGFTDDFTTFETLNLERYYCPECYANDRDRLYALFLERAIPELAAAGPVRMVDFAPSSGLSSYIRARFAGIEYRTADLFRDDVDDVVDLQEMTCYADDSISCFICSHVLEHVPDDRRAMRELYRVLAPGGWGIAMVPISTRVDGVYEDAAIVEESDRWKHFAQGDHVRMYGARGYVERLSDAGFRVRQLGVEHFSAETFRTCGISERSILYVVEK
jgi:SAM-dependent methyltransferase